MALTDEQRENRALYNLTRARANERGPLTRGQLHVASVRNATITYLLDANLVVAANERFTVTDAGALELDARINSGRGSTIS